MNKQSRKYLLKAISFILLWCLVFILLEKFFFNPYDINFSKKLQEKDTNPVDILFMGPSTAYATFDAYMLSKMFNKEIYTLACSGGDIDLLRENLKVVLKYQKPKIIIIDSYALYHSSIENIEDNTGLMLNNFDGIINPIYKIEALYAYFHSYLPLKDIPIEMFQFQLLRNTDIWKRWEWRWRWGNIKTNQYSYLSYNIRDKVPFSSYGMLSDDSLFEKVKNNITVKQSIMQAENLEYPYFEQNLSVLKDIILIAKKNDIEIWILVPPGKTGRGYDQTKQLSEIIKSQYRYVSHFDNLKDKVDEIGLNPMDYFDDITHLNRRGMAKVTQYYANIIQERTRWEIADTDFFAYTGESIDKISNNMWRYTMKNMQSNAWYKFTLLKGKEIIKIQEFSKNNYFDCDVNILENSEYSVNVIILPAKTESFDEKTIEEIGMRLSFMKYLIRLL
jgi:hypothetical protein